MAVAFVKCCIEGCKHAGTLEFRVRIPAIGYEATPENCINLHLGLATCAAHKAEVKAAELFPEEARATITDAMNRIAKAAPDFDRAFLEWMKL